MERLKLETIENIIGVEKTTIEAFEKNGEIATLDKCILMGMEELKQYRIAEEQGLLLRLPCNVGSMVYEIKKDLNQMKRETIEHNGHYYHRNIDVYFVTQVTFEIEDIVSLGKTVFLTKEEAEAVLAKMKEV
jgi:hypothetical protein